ncbi:programmed cell death protein 5, partial [Tremellales sp. Uapishka_1]
MSNFQLPPGMKPAAPPGGGGGDQGPSNEEKQAKERAQEEMKRNMIAAMLEPAARERCASTVSRISLTRPQLAKQVEGLLVNMGQQGQIRGQVTDEALKGLLEQVSNPPPAKTTAPLVSSAGGRTRTIGGGITIQRKRDDSDSDEYDL